AFGDAFLERAAGDVLRGQVVDAGVAADIVDGDQVRMLQLGGDPALAEEAAGELAVGRQRRRHHLQRHLAVERFLHGQEHRGHAALADRPDDPVTGNVDVDRTEQDGGVQPDLRIVTRPGLRGAGRLLPKARPTVLQDLAQTSAPPALAAIFSSRASWAARSASLARSSRRAPAGSAAGAGPETAAVRAPSPPTARTSSAWPEVRPRETSASNSASSRAPCSLQWVLSTPRRRHRASSELR